MLGILTFFAYNAAAFLAIYTIYKIGDYYASERWTEITKAKHIKHKKLEVVKDYIRYCCE